MLLFVCLFVVVVVVFLFFVFFAFFFAPQKAIILQPCFVIIMATSRRLDDPKRVDDKVTIANDEVALGNCHNTENGLWPTRELRKEMGHVVLISGVFIRY